MYLVQQECSIDKIQQNCVATLIELFYILSQSPLQTCSCSALRTVQMEKLRFPKWSDQNLPQSCSDSSFLALSTLLRAAVEEHPAKGWGKGIYGRSPFRSYKPKWEAQREGSFRGKMTRLRKNYQCLSSNSLFFSQRSRSPQNCTETQQTWSGLWSWTLRVQIKKVAC